MKRVDYILRELSGKYLQSIRYDRIVFTDDASEAYGYTSLPLAERLVDHHYGNNLHFSVVKRTLSVQLEFVKR